MAIPNALTMKQFLGLDRPIVFCNSPAEGQLQRGDIIDAIGIKRGGDLSHKQAQDSLKHGGGQIELNITRPSGTGISSAPPNITPVPTRAPQQNFDPYPEQKPQMPQPKAYGHQPKKVTVSKYGGGGPSYGAEYGVTSTSVQSNSGKYRPGPADQYNMLNRVQGSLDNIILSPRAPEASQSQAPFYQPYDSYAAVESTPNYQYQQPQQQPISTGERLDRMKEYQGDYPDHSTPAYEPQPSPRSYYRSTSDRLDEIAPEDEENQVPIRDRRQAFMGPSSIQHASKPIKQKRPAPKFKKQTGPIIGTNYSNVGIDYAQKVKNRPSSGVWQESPSPQQQYQQQQQYRQPDATSFVHTPYEDGEPTVPVWRNTLKQSGIKPWEEDLDYSIRNPAPEVHEVPRLVPDPVPKPPQAMTASNNAYDQNPDPNIVHLQYNSPMSLYSNDKVQETIDGQTRLKAAELASKQPTMQPARVTQKSPGSHKAPMISGERDWSQSAVFRMVTQDEHNPSQGQQRSGGQREVAPPPAPKPSAQPPQFRPNQFQTQYGDEVGVTDF